MKSAPLSLIPFALSALALIFSPFCRAGTAALIPPDDWPSANWKIIDSGAPAVVQTVETDGHLWLEIARTEEEGGSAQVVYTGGDEMDSEANQFGDFSGSVVVRGRTGVDGGGVILRAATSKWVEPQRYYIVIHTENQDMGEKKSGGLAIYTVEGSGFLYQDGATLLAMSDAVVKPNQEYLLRFSAQGPVVKASLSEFDPYTGEFDQEVVSVQIDNAEFLAPGWVGLRAGRLGSPGIYLKYRNFEIRPGPPTP